MGGDFVFFVPSSLISAPFFFAIKRYSEKKITSHITVIYGNFVAFKYAAANDTCVMHCSKSQSMYIHILSNECVYIRWLNDGAYIFGYIVRRAMHEINKKTVVCVRALNFFRIVVFAKFSDYD